MSDEKLRELERRFKETGSPDDEEAWLVERVRTGDLAPDRLALAAGLGHLGCQAVAAKQGRASVSPGLSDVLQALAKTACVEAAIAAASHAHEFWRQQNPSNSHPGSAIAAARNWLMERSENARRQAAVAAERARTAAAVVTRGAVGMANRERSAALSAEHCARAAAAAAAQQARDHAAQAIEHAEAAEPRAIQVSYGALLSRLLEPSGAA